MPTRSVAREIDQYGQFLRLKPEPCMPFQGNPVTYKICTVRVVRYVNRVEVRAIEERRVKLHRANKLY